MLLLTATTDKLQLVTSAAATVDVHASWMDISGTTVTPGRTNTAITTAATTDIVAAPGASTSRNIKTLHIRNKHASTSTDVTVVYDANGTDYELHKCTLLAGEQLEYIEGVGFFVIALEAAAEEAGSGAVTVAKLASDQSNSTTTLTEVTGLSTTTGTGTFQFKYAILYQAAATTTGVRLSVNHSGTVSFFVADVVHPDGPGTGAADQDDVAGTTYRGYTARAKSTTGWGSTASVDTANADMLAFIEGLMRVTADGDIELWHGSEVAAASTVKAGSSLILTRTGD